MRKRKIDKDRNPYSSFMSLPISGTSERAFHIQSKKIILRQLLLDIWSALGGIISDRRFSPSDQIKLVDLMHRFNNKRKSVFDILRIFEDKEFLEEFLDYTCRLLDKYNRSINFLESLNSPMSNLSEEELLTYEISQGMRRFQSRNKLSQEYWMKAINNFLDDCIYEYIFQRIVAEGLSKKVRKRDILIYIAAIFDFFLRLGMKEIIINKIKPSKSEILNFKERYNLLHIERTRNHYTFRDRIFSIYPHKNREELLFIWSYYRDRILWEVKEIFDIDPEVSVNDVIPVLSSSTYKYIISHFLDSIDYRKLKEFILVVPLGIKEIDQINCCKLDFRLTRRLPKGLRKFINKMRASHYRWFIVFEKKGLDINRLLEECEARWSLFLDCIVWCRRLPISIDRSIYTFFWKEKFADTWNMYSERLAVPFISGSKGKVQKLIDDFISKLLNDRREIAKKTLNSFHLYRLATEIKNVESKLCFHWLGLEALVDEEGYKEPKLIEAISLYQLSYYDRQDIPDQVDDLDQVRRKEYYRNRMLKLKDSLKLLYKLRGEYLFHKSKNIYIYPGILQDLLKNLKEMHEQSLRCCLEYIIADSDCRSFGLIQEHIKNIYHKR